VWASSVSRFRAPRADQKKGRLTASLVLENKSTSLRWQTSAQQRVDACSESRGLLLLLNHFSPAVRQRVLDRHGKALRGVDNIKKKIKKKKKKNKKQKKKKTSRLCRREPNQLFFCFFASP